MSILTLLIVVVLVFALIGALPAWPHAANWGPGPSGLIGVVLIIVVIILLSGRL